MNAKHLTALSVENFRGFTQLKLEGLQAVNLIVGENNSGKTSLLEAIAFAANPDLIQQTPEMLRANAGNMHLRYYPWLVKDFTGDTTGYIHATRAVGDCDVWFYKRTAPAARPSRTIYSQDGLTIGYTPNAVQLRVRITSVQQRTPASLVKSFGNAVRKREGEELVHQILGAVDSRIRRVRVDPVQEGNIISVDIGLSESVPISQVGQGVYRLVAILSDLIGEAPQICIIDEIENGLHYTVMAQVWRGIREISAKLGIQIFATTHSGECLEAAQSVFYDEDSHAKDDFAVIQLMRVRGEITCKVLQEEQVELAVENDIELR